MTAQPQNTSSIITRFAPSPTGWLHVGSVRTALFNYLYARQKGGKLILRIEDTDKERSKAEYEQDIREGFKWLGLSFDEEYRQSDRGAIYKRYLEKMIADGKAYVSKETPTVEGGRSEVIRFRNPNKTITFTDLIRGDITFDTTELKDFVIAKSVDEPLYHLAVVVDDFESNISHIIRGEDHISNTPRQILIQEAIGAPRPTYAHLPLILAEDRSKLSKRKHGESVSVSFYRKEGYLPEALINFFALLGWNPGDEREIFSLSELVQEFSIEKIQKGGAVFNQQKLDWVNKQHLLKLSPEKQHEAIRPLLPENISGNDALISRLLPTILERINKFGEVRSMVEAGEFDYYAKSPVYDPEQLLWKGKIPKEEAAKHLEEIGNILRKMPTEHPAQELVKSSVWPYAEAHGRGNVLWPMRFSLSGKEKSPDPFTLVYILGKEESIRRIADAEKKLNTAA